MGSCSLLAGWLLLFCPCGSTEEGGALTEFQKPGGKISSVQLSNYFYARHAAIFSFVLAAGECRTGEGGNVNELLKSDQVHQFYFYYVWMKCSVGYIQLMN